MTNPERQPLDEPPALRPRRPAPADGFPAASADGALVRRFQQGDAGVFDAIVRRHEGRVRSVLYRLVGNADDAEDLAQETFIRAFENLAGFRGDAALGTWLLRIAANLARDRLRRNRRQPPAIALDACAEPPAPAPPHGSTPGAALEMRDRTRAVAVALEQLPFKQRAALTLKIVADLDYGEIARALGTTRNAVKANIHQARKRLAAILGRRLDGPPQNGPGDEDAKGRRDHGRMQI